MAAIPQILAAFLAFSALCSALPLQPCPCILPHMTRTNAIGSGFPALKGLTCIAHSTNPVTQTLGIIDRPDSSTRPSVPVVAAAAVANATNSAQEQSSWNSGLTSTVVFGCIASILGMLAIWATMWLGRRQTSFTARNSTLSIPTRIM